MNDSPDHLSVVVRCASEAATEALGHALAEIVRADEVIALVGALGAGKTRLVRGIAEGLGVDPTVVSSPTFVLINEYEGRLSVFHFDAYRLSSASQFDALGVGDYWDAGGVCLVEWADRVSEWIPSRAWWITAAVEAPGRHRYSMALPRELGEPFSARLREIARLPESGLSLD